MSYYTRRQLAKIAGISTVTLWRRINELTKQNLFKKKTPGVLLSENEAQKIAALLDFKLK